jgi:hypothetical protein
MVFLAPADGTRSQSPQAAGGPETAATPSAGGLPPAEPTTGRESIDLERLADEVYAIIERRLTIERESLGE